MSGVLILAFLFFMGSLFGWGLEFWFRKFFSPSNPEHKWINPGFLSGPYVPLYGFGLVLLYLIATLEQHFAPQNLAAARLLLFVTMAVCMTAIEYLAGALCLRFLHVRLWDYSNRWGNVRGIICPLFSLFWTLLGAVYYFFVHPHILNALQWLANNLAFSFFIGFFYGVFLLDTVHATKLLLVIRRFAAEHQIVIRYEELKTRILQYKEAHLIKASFLFAMHSDLPMREHLRDYYEQGKARMEALSHKLPRKK